MTQSSQNQARIGVSMIVKDAENSVENAIASAKLLSRHIVVVDTGSTDATPVRAARSGAELYFRQWTNDFSEARNTAIKHMRSDWVLVLDADERVDEESIEDMDELLSDPSIGGLRIRIINALGEGNSTFSEHYYTRLFRNHPQIRFRGEIHEQIADSIKEAGLRIADCNLRIIHDGYRQVNSSKNERNTIMLKSQLEKNPSDVWTQYHLGLTRFSAGSLDEAYSILMPLRNSMELSQDQKEMACIRCAQACLAKDDYMQVEELLAFQSQDVAREGLRLYILGAAQCTKHNFAEALRYFVNARSSGSQLVDQEFLSNTISQLSSIVENRR